MRSLQSCLSLALLLVLALTALPAGRPAYAQSGIVVANLTDTDNGGTNDCGPDTCSLREAIRLANTRSGANTITFSVAGTIQPATPLPDLTGDGTTIDGGTGHNVVIDGIRIAEANGLTIRSSNNTVRGLVIVNFRNNGDDFTYGSGIYLSGRSIGGDLAGGDNNQIYGNYIGVDSSGATAAGNAAYGVFIANGASNNRIGADSAADRNIIAGNLGGGLRLSNTLYNDLLEDNSIVGNYIGIAANGTALPSNLDATAVEGGVVVSNGSHGTIVRDNVIGGLTSEVAAGIKVTGFDSSSPQSDQVPQDTRITGNFIGVSRTGVKLANRLGIGLGGDSRFGPRSTTIGDASDPSARNVIAGNSYRGIELPDTSFPWGDATIAGNYIGLNGSGQPEPNGFGVETGSGVGIYIGRTAASGGMAVGKVTVGPGNVISASRTYGIWARTGGHVIKGNRIGTNPEGSSSLIGTVGSPGTANGAANIFLEHGSGTLIGGPAPADRNIIAYSNSATAGFAGGILINPLVSPGNCGGSNCVSGGHTIEGNAIGVAVDGVSALNATQTVSKEGIRLRATTGNTIKDNLIGGLNQGIVLGGATSGTEAGNNLIVGNKIGAPAGGEIPFASRPTAGQIVAPRNRAEGIKIFRGSGNTIRANLVAYNVADEGLDAFAGIQIGDSDTSASNNVLEDNRLVRNGETYGWGIVVDSGSGVRLSRNTTQYNQDNGIQLRLGGNGGLQPPTLSLVQAGSPPTLTGTSGCLDCTVEVFSTGQASEAGEGPLYLTSAKTNATTGAISVPLPVCQRYLTATVTDGSGNTSEFSNQLDTGSPGPCQQLVFSLGAATNPSRNVTAGSSTVYTHTITHNAPVTITYTVVFTSSLGWASAPALVSVPPASGGGTATADLAVTVTVPPGTAAGPPADVTTVQLFAGSQSSNSVQNSTTPQALTQNQAQPAVSGPLTQVRAGATVTFDHTVTNTGDLQGTFLVSTPAFVGTAPSGWSIGSVTPARMTLGGGQTSPLEIVVNTPTLPPPTAPVTISFTVSVEGASPPRLVSQVDYITIPVSRSFALAPTASEVITTPAGADVRFTYALTNTGNAADSFSIDPAAPTPGVTPPITSTVSSSPALSSLPAGATAAVTVTYRVPSGTATGSYSSTITAEAAGGTGAPAPQGRDVTINVTGGGSVIIAPGAASLNPVSPGTSPVTVTFTNLVTNTGNADVPVTIGLVTGAPSSWAAEVITTTCPVSPTVLTQRTGCAFTVEVTVPPGAAGGPVDLTVSATAYNSDPDVPDVTATALNTVNVAVVRGLELAPTGLADTGGPGQVLTFTHTLTNTGNAPDSFDLALEPSDPRWTVSVSPTVVTNLAVGVPRTVEVTASGGAGIVGGTTSVITLTATGQGDGPSATVTDTVTMASVSGGDLSTVRRSNVNPGETAVYSFTVVNTGTVPLSYTVTLADSAADWVSQAGGVPTAVLAPAISATLTVSVTAPIDAAPGVTNTTTVQLRPGDGAGAPFDTSTVVTGIGPRRGVSLTPETQAGAGLPRSTVVFTHTLRNLGSETGTFRLTTVDSLGWKNSVAPDLVTLGPGASVEVSVYVNIDRDDLGAGGAPGSGQGPAKTRAGTKNAIGVTAELVGDPTVSAEAINTLTVGLVAGLDLSAEQQVRSVRPGDRLSLGDLGVFNSGNSYDTVDLAVEGAGVGWELTLGQSSIGLDRQSGGIVPMSLTVPSSLASDTVKTIRVVGRSSADSSVSDVVRLTLVYVAPFSPVREQWLVYLPMAAR